MPNNFINQEKGVSLIIIFFVMLILIAVVLSVSVLLYSEIKVVRNMSESVVSFYAADSGVEKVLYYDRKTLPVISTGASCTDAPCVSGECVNGICTVYAKRGLCGICSACPKNPETGGLTGNDAPLYCDSCNIPKTAGCAPGVCNNCVITFSTPFDGESYSVTATVATSTNPYYLQVDSSGLFDGVGRAINTLNGSDDVSP